MVAFVVEEQVLPGFHQVDAPQAVLAVQQDRREAGHGSPARRDRVVALDDVFERHRGIDPFEARQFLESRERVVRPHQARSLREKLERRVARELAGCAQECRHGFLDVAGRRVPRPPVSRYGTLQVRIHGDIRQGGPGAGAAGDKSLVLVVGPACPELLAELDVPERGREIHLVAEVVQHVHHCHARDRIGGIRRKLVARDPAHVQVGQTAFERIADFDACLLDTGIQDHEQAAGRRRRPDLPLPEDALRLHCDSRAGLFQRHDVHVDAEIGIERIRHSAKTHAERRQDPRRVLDARVPLSLFESRWHRRCDGNGLIDRHRAKPDRGARRDHEQRHEQGGASTRTLRHVKAQAAAKRFPADGRSRRARRRRQLAVR